MRGEISASYVYEDKEVIAFLDNRPINEGHTLVIPRRHHQNVYEIPEEEAAYLFKIVKKIADAIRKGLKPEGIKIIQNNGRSVGQVVFHLHFHIIPRFEEQESYKPREFREAKELDKVAKKIKNSM